MKLGVSIRRLFRFLMTYTIYEINDIEVHTNGDAIILPEKLDAK